MKRIIVASLAFALLMLQGVSAHGMHHDNWDMMAGLPARLNLTPAQNASFNAYCKDMQAGMMKDHEAHVAEVQKILTPEQWKELQGWMEHNQMKHMEPKSDDDVKAMVADMATKLLFTADQETEVDESAIKMFHQEKQLMDAFYSRLDKVLNPAQQKKLAAWRAKWGE